jgi:hypothetical protein
MDHRGEPERLKRCARSWHAVLSSSAAAARVSRFAARISLNSRRGVTDAERALPMLPADHPQE